MKIHEGYDIVINYKDGSSERIQCEDFEAREGKLALYNASVEEDEVDFVIIMEDTLHSYVGTSIKK